MCPILWFQLSGTRIPVDITTLSFDAIIVFTREIHEDSTSTVSTRIFNQLGESRKAFVTLRRTACFSNTELWSFWIKKEVAEAKILGAKLFKHQLGRYSWILSNKQAEEISFSSTLPLRGSRTKNTQKLQNMSPTFRHSTYPENFGYGPVPTSVYEPPELGYDPYCLWAQAGMERPNGHEASVPTST